MSDTPNQEIRCARCGTVNHAGAVLCRTCRQVLPVTAPQHEAGEVAHVRQGQTDASMFAPAGAAIVMALVITGFAIMWDSPQQQFQGRDGSSGMLILVLLALAQLAVMAPAVFVVGRATAARGVGAGRLKLGHWLLLIVGSILTVASAVMGPALFVWIGGLNPGEIDLRQPLLVAYLVVPLLGVALVYGVAHATFRPASSKPARSQDSRA